VEQIFENNPEVVHYPICARLGEHRKGTMRVVGLVEVVGFVEVGLDWLIYCPRRHFNVKRKNKKGLRR
jgi:hypothetical protein